MGIIAMVSARRSIVMISGSNAHARERFADDRASGQNP